jgi:nitrite reductase/ring-hydroxylating ferredoxin subunit
MHDCTDEVLLEAWFPIAASYDVPKRHVFHGQLLGQELAVWRDDEDWVNVWENRCLHRGVRLSIGLNLGMELKCQYHGWRYSSRNAGCTYIPAHPADAPPRLIHNTIYKGVERHGLVWSSLRAAGKEPPPLYVVGPTLTLRSIPVSASAPRVAEALMEYRFAPNDDLATDLHTVEMSVAPADPFMLNAQSRTLNAKTPLMLIVQPVEQRRSIIHGIIPGDVDPQARMSVLRHHSRLLSQVRDTVEMSGNVVLDLKQPAKGAARAYRDLIAGRFKYGLAA